MTNLSAKQGSLTISLGYEEPDEMEYSLATLMMNIVNDEKVEDLNEEFARLLSEKKAAYSEYKKIKKEMRDYQIAKQQ